MPDNFDQRAERPGGSCSDEYQRCPKLVAKTVYESPVAHDELLYVRLDHFSGRKETNKEKRMSVQCDPMTIILEIHFYFF